MSLVTPTKTIRVAVVGNPNTGKSTLFTALAGVRQRVGNYPGVTVEKKTGHLKHGDHDFELIDLPGTYSLAPRSPDEMVAVDVLLGRRDNDSPPDVVLSIVDASNLERNLFLVSQVLALGLPTVIALNMVDLARDRHDRNRCRRPCRSGWAYPLSRCKPIAVAASTSSRTRSSQLSDMTHRSPKIRCPPSFSGMRASSTKSINAGRTNPVPSFLVERLLLDSDGYLEGELLNGDANSSCEPTQAGP